MTLRKGDAMTKILCKDVGLEIEIIVDSTITNKGSSFIYQNARSFFNNIVKENLNEFYKDETDHRKAINACITLYHLTDWHCSNKEEKKKMWRKIPYNDALESIANGTKHFNREKPYQTGRKKVSNMPEKIILNNGKNIIELKHMLKEIEKYWDSILNNQ